MLPDRIESKRRARLPGVQPRRRGQVQGQKGEPMTRAQAGVLAVAALPFLAALWVCDRIITRLVERARKAVRP